jgi:uncharacterized protein (TIGR02246 family)
VSALEAIKRLNIEIGAIQTRGDARAMTEFYVDEAVLLPPNAQPIKGKPAIFEFLSTVLPNVAHFTSETKEVEVVRPDVLVEQGVYRTVTRNPDAAVLTGKYLVLWREVGGIWKITHDMWSPLA